MVPVNWLLADTTDATAASGYVFVGGAVLGGFAALYHWFPKMTGRTMGESLGRASFALILIGAHVTFLPMFLAGLEGQPVDVYKYFDTGNLGILNLISSLGSLVLAAGVVLTLANLYTSVTGGRPRRPRSVARREPRVARPLASPAAQLRRRPRRPQRRADARHPRRDSRPQGDPAAAEEPDPVEEPESGEPVA